jgi:hypothetical protein
MRRPLPQTRQKTFYWRPVASTEFDGDLPLTQLMWFLLSGMELRRPRFGCYSSIGSLFEIGNPRNAFLH